MLSQGAALDIQDKRHLVNNSFLIERSWYTMESYQ